MELLRRLAIAAHLLHVILMAAAEPVNTPVPMLEPAFESCEQFHLAGDGEDCNPLIAASGLTRAEFFRINPAVGGEDHCQDKIIPNFWYCVRAFVANNGPPPNHAIPHYDLPMPTPAPTTTDGEGDGTENESNSQEPEPPKMTPGPKAPEDCAFGNCWVEFAKLSFEGADVQQHAADLCTSVFNFGCDHDALDFPDGVKRGCKNCEEISSGCPCFTDGRYHTYTNLPIFKPGYQRSRVAGRP